jgi:putative IMPACT (imprinted ancient) family translation regulator
VAHVLKKKFPTAKVIVKEGNISVNGQKYNPALRPPTLQETLTVDAQTVDVMTNINFYASDTITQKGSSFQAFVSPAPKMQDAHYAYLAISRFPGVAAASHIVSAYLIGGNVFDYHDDRDWGLGRYVYELIEEQKFDNVIVFLARDYGGTHLGKARFDIINTTVTQALSKFNAAIKRDPSILQPGNLHVNAPDQSLNEAGLPASAVPANSGKGQPMAGPHNVAGPRPTTDPTSAAGPHNVAGPRPTTEPTSAAGPQSVAGPHGESVAGTNLQLPTTDKQNTDQDEEQHKLTSNNDGDADVQGDKDMETDNVVADNTRHKTTYNGPPTEDTHGINGTQAQRIVEQAFKPPPPIQNTAKMATPRGNDNEICKELICASISLPRASNQGDLFNTMMTKTVDWQKVKFKKTSKRGGRGQSKVTSSKAGRGRGGSAFVPDAGRGRGLGSPYASPGSSGSLKLKKGLDSKVQGSPKRSADEMTK